MFYAKIEEEKGSKVRLENSGTSAFIPCPQALKLQAVGEGQLAESLVCGEENEKEVMQVFPGLLHRTTAQVVSEPSAERQREEEFHTEKDSTPQGTACGLPSQVQKHPTE